MNKNLYIYLTILGMAVVTYIPRILPLAFFARYKMDRELERFISYFPVSILTALVIKELFYGTGNFIFNIRNFIPALITLFISIRYRSIGLSIAVGVISYIFLKILI